MSSPPWNTTTYPIRLPTPGGDNNAWGQILENFLSVSFQFTLPLTGAQTPGTTNGLLDLTQTGNYATASLPGHMQLAGDLAGTGSSATSPQLATVNTSGAGTYGSSTAVPVLTVDVKGRITSVTTVTPTAPTQRSFAFFNG